jgi:transcriptional regulator with XRE-family HTH domain
MALTVGQLKKLRAAHDNRVAAAMEMAELTQAQLADAIGLTQPYVSDVCRGRFATITVENAHKFAEFFGCAIEDLFPSRTAVAS